jgi:hypothetical protein
MHIVIVIFFTNVVLKYFSWLFYFQRSTTSYRIQNTRYRTVKYVKINYDHKDYIYLQAARCSVVPDVQIPTDDHLKRFGKKLPKPLKSSAVEATKRSRRFREEHQEKERLHEC